jgi:hypothetical protein
MATSGARRSSASGKFGKVPVIEKRGGKVPTGSVVVATPPKGGSKQAPASSVDGNNE